MVECCKEIQWHGRVCDHNLTSNVHFSAWNTNFFFLWAVQCQTYQTIQVVRSAVQYTFGA